MYTVLGYIRVAPHNVGLTSLESESTAEIHRLLPSSLGGKAGPHTQPSFAFESDVSSAAQDDLELSGYLGHVLELALLQPLPSRGLGFQV